MLPDTNLHGSSTVLSVSCRAPGLSLSTPGLCLDTSVLALLQKFGYWECGFRGGQTESYMEPGLCTCPRSVTSVSLPLSMAWDSSAVLWGNLLLLMP